MLVLVCRFTLRIARRTIYYIYQVIYPCMTMSMLTLVVFYLPPGAPCPCHCIAAFMSHACCAMFSTRMRRARRERREGHAGYHSDARLLGANALGGRGAPADVRVRAAYQCASPALRPPPTHRAQHSTSLIPIHVLSRAQASTCSS